MTCFELGVHTPLVLRAPWIGSSIGKETAVLAELVDLFPSLAELAGLPDPRTVAGCHGINGTSLVPALADPAGAAGLKPAAYSQFSKNNLGPSPEVTCNASNEYCVHDTYFRNQTQVMGYSIR